MNYCALPKKKKHATPICARQCESVVFRPNTHLRLRTRSIPIESIGTSPSPRPDDTDRNRIRTGSSRRRWFRQYWILTWKCHFSRKKAQSNTFFVYNLIKTHANKKKCVLAQKVVLRFFQCMHLVL